MSIDRFHFIAKGDDPSDIESLPEPRLGMGPGSRRPYHLRDACGRRAAPGGPLPHRPRRRCEPTEEEAREIKQFEADVRAGKVVWCDACEEWVPRDEMRDDPWGSGERICIDCLADQGIEKAKDEKSNELSTRH